MKTEEMIKILKEKGYKIEEPEPRFLEVQFSNEEHILLENEDNFPLVETWGSQKLLNNFEVLREQDFGHFIINGYMNNFEFFYKDEWLRCDTFMPVRFLK